MNRKFWVGLLVLTFVLGPVSGFWAKPAQANTGSERRVMLCAAWPWSDDLPMANNPTPPDTSGLSTAGTQVKMQANHQNSVPNKPSSRDRNLFHLLLHTLWGMIFPESF